MFLILQFSWLEKEIKKKFKSHFFTPPPPALAMTINF